MHLVIFDCDGVLVDSELITNRVLVQMLNEIGLAVTLPDMFELFVGKSMPQCYELIERLRGAALPPDFDAAYVARTTAALSTEIEPVAGIGQVLDALDQRGIRYCVASSGTHQKMRTTLGATGLLPRFEAHLYSVTEVAIPKPAPDVYLYAARCQDQAPADCVVVEDSPTGCRAGVAAGMQVYGYCAHTPRARLLEAGAHVLVARMTDLPSLWFGGVTSPG